MIPRVLRTESVDLVICGDRSFGEFEGPSPVMSEEKALPKRRMDPMTARESSRMIGVLSGASGYGRGGGGGGMCSFESSPSAALPTTSHWTKALAAALLSVVGPWNTSVPVV